MNETGTYAAQAIYNAANTTGVNPKLLLVKLQVEQSLISAREYDPKTQNLNNAEGCGRTYATFNSQLRCSATTFAHKYTAAVADIGNSSSFFWDVDPDDVSGSIQLGLNANSTGLSCKNDTVISGCYLVSFSLENAATIAQYIYTPFVQTANPCGGGVCSFETLWHGYGC